MNRIQEQAQKLWQILSAPTTGKTYQDAWALTVQIVKETGLLLWLTICLVLVFFDWFWHFSIKTGQNFRGWIDTMGRPGPERIVSESGKSLVSVWQNSFSNLLSQAREQLGMSAPPSVAIAKPEPAKPEAPKAEAPVVAPVVTTPKSTLDS